MTLEVIETIPRPAEDQKNAEESSNITPETLLSKPNICRRCCIRISVNNSPSHHSKVYFNKQLVETIACPDQFQLLEDNTDQLLLTPELISRPSLSCFLCAGILQDGCVRQLIGKCKEILSQYEHVGRVGVTCTNLDLLSTRSYLCGVGQIDLQIKTVFKWIMGEELSTFLGVPYIVQSDSQSGDIMVNVNIRLNHMEFKWTCYPPLSWDVYDFSQGRFKYSRLVEALGKASHEDIKKYVTLPGKAINFSVSVEANATFVGGRYTKHARDISQTPWLLQDGNIISDNVEDVICKPLKEAFGADEARMHSAGREDIDVRMLGNGRPFYIQLNNVRVFPTQQLLDKLQEQVNKASQHVKCFHLTPVSKAESEIVKQGQEEKEKEYRCIIKAENEVTDEMISKLDGISDLVLQQATPIRVLHRRAPLTRSKRILNIKARLLTKGEVEECTKSDSSLTESLIGKLMVAEFTTEAGTYVKEFVHGDFNRTTPNVGSIIGNRCDILQLDVTDITMTWPPNR